MAVAAAAAEDTPLVQGASNARKHRRAKIWTALVVSVLLGLVSGSLYGFGRYSQALKDLLNLSQRQVQRFGILLDTGNYVGHPVTGYVYDRFGKRVSCLSAALIVFLAYGSIHLGVKAQASSSLAIFDIGFFLVGFGSGLGYIAALGTTTKNYRLTPHLGRAIGLVAAGYGLSSTLVGITYHYVGLDHFFLLWAVLVAVTHILGAIFLTTVDKEDMEVNSDSDSDSDDDDDEGSIALTPLGSRITDKSDSIINENDMEDMGGNLKTNHHQAEASSLSWTSWRKLDFWILFTSFACTTGCGLCVINNISTMVQSIGGQDAFAGNLVFLLSICNCFGRIVMGILADQPRLGKVALFRSVSLLMSAALFLSAFAGLSSAQISLVVTVACVSVAYGGAWVLIVGILAEWFGDANFGKNYGFIIMGPALTGMAFNMASTIFYQRHTGDDSDVCLGLACYRGAFVLTGTAAVVSWVLLSFARH